ncbi:MAG: hypothetical protein WAU27_05400, partial [Pseudomonadales bacterium]
AQFSGKPGRQSSRSATVKHSLAKGLVAGAYDRPLLADIDQSTAKARLNRAKSDYMLYKYG